MLQSVSWSDLGVMALEMPSAGIKALDLGKLIHYSIHAPVTFKRTLPRESPNLVLRLERLTTQRPPRPKA